MGTKYNIECPHCGLSYDDLRTGLTYQDVYHMYWVNSNDPKRWRYKRRHTVLGKWHQIKMEMWEEHLRACEAWYHLGMTCELDGKDHGIDYYECEERVAIRSEHRATLADLEFP